MDINEQKVALVDKQHALDGMIQEMQMAQKSMQESDAMKAIQAKQAAIIAIKKEIADLKKAIFG